MKSRRKLKNYIRYDCCEVGYYKTDCLKNKGRGVKAESVESSVTSTPSYSSGYAECMLAITMGLSGNE